MASLVFAGVMPPSDLVGVCWSDAAEWYPVHRFAVHYLWCFHDVVTARTDIVDEPQLLISCASLRMGSNF